jgi:hypothetical protein
MIFGKRCPNCGGYHSPLAPCATVARMNPVPQLAELQRQADVLENLAIERYRHERHSNRPQS